MKKIDDEDSLLSVINKSSKLNLQVKTGKFSKGDSEIIDSIKWVPGVTKDMKKNDQVVFVDVKKVLPSQPKSLMATMARWGKRWCSALGVRPQVCCVSVGAWP